MTWAWDNRSVVIDLFLVHAWLSVVPIVVGFVLAVPVGWYASRHPRLRGVLLSGGSILYTIPSLPLFVLLPGIIGTGFLDPLNVVIALSIYAFAIMVRTAADAFTAVSPAVLDAATATGPDGFARLCPGSSGAIYGRALHGWQSAFQRPGARTQIPGLYLAGGGTHPGPGVPTSMISGRTAARSILADLVLTRRSRPAGIAGSTPTPSATTDATASS